MPKKIKAKIEIKIQTKIKIKYSGFFEVT